MTKTIVHSVFVSLIVVLSLLVCREWTVHCITDNSDAIYQDKVTSGQHPITASADASNGVLLVWFMGCCTILGGIIGGGHAWSRSVLWPAKLEK